MNPESTRVVTTACEECDWLVSATPLDAGSRIECERCQHTISDCAKQPFTEPLAYAFTSIVMLLLSYAFPFMSFSSSGVTINIHFYQAMSRLVDNDFAAIAAFLFISLTLLPLLCLILIIALHSKFQQASPRRLWQLKMLEAIKPWIMVDVFLVGILVALIKIMSMADVGFGLSFWAFCLFTLAFLKTLLSVDMHWLWHQHAGPLPTLALPNEITTSQQAHLIRCHHCGALNQPAHSHCNRCHSAVFARKRNSIQSSVAFLFAAAVFYIPANLFPIMDMRLLGQSEPSTIIGGVLLLWKLGSYPVALIIFFASIMIPIAKMLALAWLCFYATRNQPEQAKAQLTIYRITEFVGRWSMIDVFVVAVLVALVHIDGIVVVYPGNAALSFAGVVVLTMLSAISFDPRIIWDPSPQSEHKTC